MRTIIAIAAVSALPACDAIRDAVLTSERVQAAVYDACTAARDEARDAYGLELSEAERAILYGALADRLGLDNETRDALIADGCDVLAAEAAGSA